MAKVSVIIAAYNVEEYIAETLDSAVSQTLKDIEIVVVDDCSTDGTSGIISEYAKTDERIKVVRHEENGGLVRVRQTGLKSSTGEYVIFLDGDDKLSRDACEKAYNAITAENVDMLQFDFELMFVPPARYSKTVEYDQHETRRAPGRKIMATSKAGLLDEKTVGGTVNFTIWDKIYKRTLLEEAAAYVPDEYLNMAEDVLYSFIIQYHAHSFSFIPDRLYIYRYGCGMSTTTRRSERLLRSIAKNAYVYNYLSDFAKGVGSQNDCASALQRVQKQLYTHIVDAYTHSIDKEERDFLLSEALKYGNAEHLVLTLSEYLYSELQGYRNSESYRIGMILTYIPRKIIWFLKRLFGKGDR